MNKPEVAETATAEAMRATSGTRRDDENTAIRTVEATGEVTSVGHWDRTSPVFRTTMTRQADRLSKSDRLREGTEKFFEGGYQRRPRTEPIVSASWRDSQLDGKVLMELNLFSLCGNRVTWVKP